VLADPSLPSPAPEILDYLARHPDTRDTIEGIYWWVLEASIRNWAPQIRNAVAHLVERGFLLQEEPSKDGKVFYQISPCYRAQLSQQSGPEI
jgi:hypothetical protein